MLNKRARLWIGIILIGILLISMGYIFRFDRFGMTKIDWVDCVQINNKKYGSSYNRTPIEASLVGKRIGKVKFNVSESVSNPSYRFRNGDATFLEVGTEIYSLPSETNAIAVKIGEQYYIYKSE